MSKAEKQEGWPLFFINILWATKHKNLPGAVGNLDTGIYEPRFELYLFFNSIIKCRGSLFWSGGMETSLCFRETRGKLWRAAKTRGQRWKHSKRDWQHKREIKLGANSGICCMLALINQARGEMENVGRKRREEIRQENWEKERKEER